MTEVIYRSDGEQSFKGPLEELMDNFMQSCGRDTLHSGSSLKEMNALIEDIDGAIDMVGFYIGSGEQGRFVIVSINEAGWQAPAPDGMTITKR